MKRNLFFVVVLMVGALLRLSAAPTVLVNGTTRHVLEPGGSVTLSVATAGAGAITHQWFRNGAAFPGQTGAALAIASATRADSGWYCADVTDDTGTTRSKPIFVTVAPAGLRVRTWGDGELRFRPPAALGGVIALKAYNYITMGLRRDGTVTGWGTFGNIKVPEGLNNVVALSASYERYAALRSDGVVVEWAESVGTYPRQPPEGLANVVAVGLSTSEAVALKSDGTVVSWGDESAPKPPAGLNQVTAIAVGEMHALALRADATVVAWGRNYNGQCDVPAGLAGVVAIEAGAYHSLALKADGTVVAWGGNSPEVSAVPVGLTQVIGLVAGHAHTLALKSDGSVVAWGVEEVGELQPPASLAPVHGLAAGHRRSLALDNGSTPLIAPTITQSPTSLTVDPTASAVFQVAATGTDLAYRWQIKYPLSSPDDPWQDLGAGGESLNFTGGLSPTLTVLNAQFDQSGTQYRCAVSNDAGVATSAAATLSVNVPQPVIVTDTKDAVVDLNANAFFSVSTVSPVPMTYRWQFRLRGETEWSEHSTAEVGAGNPATRQIILTATLANHGAQVRCLITNSAGTVTSAVARIVVKQAIALTPSAAARVSIVPGGTVSLSASATSAVSASLSYQWKKNNRPIPGATTATYKLANFTAADAGAYVLEVRDPFGGVARLTRFVLPDFGATQVRGWGTNASGQTTPPLTLTNAVALAAGSAHTVALRADGTLQLFGGNGQNQVPPRGITGDYAAVTAFGYRSIAVSSAGDFRGWGGGMGSTSGSENDVIAAATNLARYLLLRNDGTVRAANWDSSAYPNPKPPTELSDVVAVAMTESESLALKVDGSVVSWAVSGGAPVWRDVPAFVTEVKAIAAGARHVLALKTDGSVVAWGENADGQASVPAGLANVVEIAAGEYTSYARRADGSVVAWGRNTSGEATLPAGLGPVLTLAGGGSHALALRSAAGDAAPAITAHPVTLLREAGTSATFSVTATGAEPLHYQWRRNGVDIAGATAASYAISPVTAQSYAFYDVVVTNHVGRATSATAMLSVVGNDVPPAVTSAPPQRLIGQPGQPLTLAVAADSANLPLRYQWKKNNRPIAGATAATLTLPAFTNDAAGAYTLVITDSAGLTTYVTSFVLPFYGTTQLRYWKGWANAPKDFPAGVDQLVAIAMPFALKSDGTVLNLSEASPLAGAAAAPANATNVVAIRTGLWALALRADGTLVGWNSPYSTPPAPPADAVNLIDASVGSGHALGLRSDGRVVAWGANYHGQISVPAGLTDVVQVAAGEIHSLALQVDGTVVAWGNNESGQSTVPAGLTDVVAIAAGYRTSFALKRDGSIVAWGKDDLSQQITVPAAAAPARALFAGPYHTVALKPDGTIVPWGSISYGQQDVPADLTNVVQASVTDTFTMVLRDAANDGPPTITTHPMAKQVGAGDGFTLEVVAAGPWPLRYQWRRNGELLAGETASTFTRFTAQFADAGSYDVVVSNHKGSVTSNAATVAILVPPAITSAPAALSTIASGESLSLSVSATSPNLPLAYQWRKNNRVIVGANSASFTKAGATPADAGVYTVEITDAIGLKTWGIYHVRPRFARTQVIGLSVLNGSNLFAGVPVASIAAAGDRVFAVTTNGEVVGRSPSGSLPEGLTDVVKIAGSVYLKTDGTVKLWNQLAPEPGSVSGALTQVVDIQVGYNFGLALRADGTVVSWEIGGSGAGAPPAGLNNVVQIAVGSSHGMALKADGSVVFWGGAPQGAGAPPPWDDLSGGVEAVAAGWSYSTVIRRDGTITSWPGVDGVDVTPSVGFTDAVSLAGGNSHVLALNRAGRVIGWSRSYPQILDLPEWATSGVFAIFAPGEHIFMLRDASADTAPVIAPPAASQQITVGQTAKFAVTATGAGPLTYQWRRNGTPISGANTASLSVPVTTPWLTETYDVVVTNHVGSTTSAAATLTTRPLVQVTREGAARRVLLPGESSTFAASASGTGTLSYQWHREGRPIAGATSANWSLENATSADSGYYFVEVTDDYGSNRSDPFFVTVCPARTVVVATSGGSQGGFNPPAGLSDVIAVGAGEYGYGVALKRNGTVVGWGNQASWLNVVPAGLSEVVAVDVGQFQTLALKSDGTVVAWGRGTHVPPGLDRVVAVSAGAHYSLALRVDGSLVIWSAGAGTVPTWLQPPEDFRAIGRPVIGSDFVLATRPDGTVAGWGVAESYALSWPEGLRDVAEFDVGAGVTLARTISGELVSWGTNSAATIPATLGLVKAMAAAGNSGVAVRISGEAVFWPSYQSPQTDVLGVAAGPGSPALILREAVDALPVILVPPAFTSRPERTDAIFTVSAAGQGTLSYQWQRALSGSAAWFDLMEGATHTGTRTPNLRVAGLTLGMSREQYRCVVSNSLGSTTSAVALLEVTDDGLSPPQANLRLQTGRRVGQNLEISFFPQDVDGDFAFLSAWVTVPDGRTFVLKRDGSMELVTRSETSPDLALTTESRPLVYYLPLTAAYGAGTFVVSVRAVDQTGDVSYAADSVEVLPNRAPSVSLSLSGARTLGETLVVGMQVTDPDDSSVECYLQVFTPNRGWLTVRPDGSTVATVALDPANRVGHAAAPLQVSYLFNVIDGAGEYRFKAVVRDPADAVVESPEQLIQIEAPRTPRQLWWSAYFSSSELLDAQISGPNADPDSDGLSNLLEYALGFEPRTATTSALPEVGASASEWTYTYTRPSDRSDVTYVVEISTTLTSWTATNVTHELVSTDSVAGTQTWRARVPLVADANVFFRLKVETP